MTQQINEGTLLALNELMYILHNSARDAGWWHHPHTGEDMIDDVFFQTSKLLLIHAEVSEATEGLRKNSMDDKLSQYPNEAVELVDVIIRTLDYCGAKGYNVGQILKDKMEFNQVRPDHKIENRIKSGGKLF